MNSWVYDGFNITYKNLEINFDSYYYESKTYLLGKEIIDLGLEKKIFYKKNDNSIWIDLKDDGLDEKLLLRSDGTSVYITQDLGTAVQRKKIMIQFMVWFIPLVMSKIIILMSYLQF